MIVNIGDHDTRTFLSQGPSDKRHSTEIVRSAMIQTIKKTLGKFTVEGRNVEVSCSTVIIRRFHDARSSIGSSEAEELGVCGRRLDGFLKSFRMEFQDQLDLPKV
jgi:hypothetical protein